MYNWRKPLNHALFYKRRKNAEQMAEKQEVLYEIIKVNIEKMGEEND